MILRHSMQQAFRQFYYNEGFLEIETPILTKSTPEGARDYLVPSRVFPGSFYALPQSPQLFKQLLMISGLDRYMQIARCFRDEDLRADRQPEFTQVDLEMAFVDVDDVLDVVERSLAYVWKQVLDVDIPVPFRRMKYDEAMRDYGSDKPDLRYGVKLIDVTDLAKQSELKVFLEQIEKGGIVKAICLPGGGEMTRKETDALTAEIQGVGAGGLPLCKVAASADGSPELQTGIAKFWSASVAKQLIESMDAKVGDILFFGVGTFAAVSKHLSWLRTTLADRRKLDSAQDAGSSSSLSTCLPSTGTRMRRRFVFMHHPFTMPHDEDLAKLEATRERAGQVLRRRAQRQRAGQRLDPYPSPRYPVPYLPHVGHQRRRSPAQVHAPAQRAAVRRPRTAGWPWASTASPCSCRAPATSATSLPSPRPRRPSTRSPNARRSRRQAAPRARHRPQRGAQGKKTTEIVILCLFFRYNIRIERYRICRRCAHSINRPSWRRFGGIFRTSPRG